ncbi:VOC family protein [Amycolatopsis jiangsuensis]|uniref:Gamma-glutamyltranspeptidase/glutathione hydrolase n=1 Tax=Amycolatopsis jiangsuensis TaxID=1181879 RepID=A0A840IZL9_9PSEU|nr:VOC family protein [Amycolatopsis jiangsuensis]MBB4687123.1 gamma-glutamyltranspeptidase/glutathione hydrolase [Amycolatopsis jiangsuensis]
MSVSVELNHLIVPSRDNRESAEFLARLLDVEIGIEWGPFIPVETGNGVRLDFATVPVEDLRLQHYCFLIPETDFDAFFARLKETGVDYFGAPGGGMPGEINHNHGGRGVYFLDPGGNGMEVITQPYEPERRRPGTW